MLASLFARKEAWELSEDELAAGRLVAEALSYVRQQATGGKAK